MTEEEMLDKIRQLEQKVRDLEISCWQKEHSAKSWMHRYREMKLKYQPECFGKAVLESENVGKRRN